MANHRIEARAANLPLGYGSSAHYQTFAALARCLLKKGESGPAINYLLQMLKLDETLLKKGKEAVDKEQMLLHSMILVGLTTVLLNMGKDGRKQEVINAELLEITRQLADPIDWAFVQGKLAKLALAQRDFGTATVRW